MFGGVANLVRGGGRCCWEYRARGRSGDAAVSSGVVVVSESLASSVSPKREARGLAWFVCDPTSCKQNHLHGVVLPASAFRFASQAQLVVEL